jgi:hypothetical protein
MISGIVIIRSLGSTSVRALHLLGPVTLPVVFWGTISLSLTLGQNPDP